MFFKNYSKPTNLEDAFHLLTENKHNQLMGGGAWLKLQNSDIDTIIDLSGLGLNEIKEEGNHLVIGSMATLRDIETNDLVKSHLSGVLSHAVHSIMGMNVRNIATIGGSICGKYSFSDIFTPLMVMDTTLVFYQAGEVKLEAYLSEKKFPEDILLEVRIKKEDGKGFFKTVKKTALDFAVLNIAITNTDSFKIAVGARPGRSVRAFETEKVIAPGKLDDVVEKALEEISLSNNFRASKEYREALLKTYIRRGLKEVCHNDC